MPHEHPTTIAASLIPDPARRTQAGRRSQKQNGGVLNQEQMKFSTELFELEARYKGKEALNGFPNLSRLQLSEQVKLELSEEISTLREVGRLFSRAAKAGGEENYPANLAKTVDVLGMCFLRLATLMRAHAELTGSESNQLVTEMIETVQEFAKEAMEAYGISPK